MSDDLQDLISALDARVDDLAQRAYDVFGALVPEAQSWSADRVRQFTAQAKSRFSAVLAVVEHGAAVDEALRRDLQDVGANAAVNGSSLPQLLVTLRISRDILLQAAMRVTDDTPSMSRSVLPGFSQRMLPAIDRLTDAISNGYWQKLVDIRESALHRFESLVEGIPYGIYEVDLDGLVQFANPALSGLCGRPGHDLVGYPLNEVLKPIDGSLGGLLSEHPDDVAQTSLLVAGADGEPVTLDIDMVVRRRDDQVVGFAGLVRQASPLGIPVDLTPLVRHIHELRRSVEILSDAGEFIMRNGSLMTVDQIVGAGDSVMKQAQRLLVIIEELDADRRAIQPRDS